MIIQKPAKELAILLQTKIMVECANTEIVTRMGGNINQLNLVANGKNQFLLNNGPALW